jgi:23S rRNA (cytosine1962-C5)-methyltransferase
MNETTKIFIRKGAQHRLEAGHPWVYQSEIDYVEGDFAPGDIVDVFNFRRRFIGRGYINPRSQIIVRLLTRELEAIDREFFHKRLAAAWEYRRKFVSEPEYCRLVFGEADFLPALIVDKFGPYLVVQTLALGIDQYKDMIVELLEEMFSPAGIYERNDVPVRELEGLEQRKGYLRGQFPTMIKVQENGIPFYADIENGQKTGFFYDQRENRTMLKAFVAGGRVLDCFCHTGSFSVHAALYGAREVTSVDISEQAIELAKKNAALNGVDDRCDFRAANAFDVLRSLSDERQTFDTVILDPPAFTKNRGGIEGAARGYKEINLRGLKLVKPGGFLVTCSCSYHIDRDLFAAIVVDAARDARRTIRQVEYRTQAKDHPILPAAPETHYLKFLVLQVL